MQPELIGGRYRVEAAIGQGGMGTVWLCRDETLHRQVAVKQVGLLPGESVTDSARALREARSSAGLSHRNVVTVFDVVEESDHIWLVMEHVPGRSLSEIIKQDGPLDPATVADIGAQIADGLSALHAAGTLHRDVKPGNVLIRDDGVAKISDFGISRTVGDPTLTQSGFMSGTPSYFSPALARGAEPGPADDVWALGATLYAAVEGRSPYDRRRNPVEVLHEINSVQPPQPKRAGFLEPALQRMLDRDPGSRWSMDDAGHTLRRLADSHRPEATLHSTRPTPAQAPARLTRSPKPSRSRSSRDRSSQSRSSGDRSSRSRSSQSRSSRDQSSRRSFVRPAIIAIALLVIAGGVFATSHLLNNQKPNGAAGEQAATTSKTSKKGAGSRGGSASSGNVSKESFVRDYYAKAPGGSDQAWAMLGPGEQAQGRDSYLGFWRTIKSVDVTNVQVRAGSDTVDVTLTYRTTRGRVSTEHKRERLSTTQSGGYLLESDVPAG